MSAVRCFGRKWAACRDATVAQSRGPYCTGATNRTGAGPVVTAPQTHRRRISRCSTTWTVIGGRSNTCRTVAPTSAASTRSPPHPAAHGRFMTGHLVRGGDLLKARTGMTGLPTRLPHPGLP
jgi:hypothetical protein